MRTGLLYAAVLLVLFHRLLLGEVLYPGADARQVSPFYDPARVAWVNVHRNNITGDLWRQMGPWQLYQHRALASGRLPQWNPHEYGGIDFWANGQNAMLHPYNWAYFLSDRLYLLGPLAALRLWLCGMATCALARRLGVAPAGATLAGLAYMLGTFNVHWLGWTIGYMATWLPILLLAADRLVAAPSRRSFAVLAAATCGLQLAGHPETQFQVGVTAGLFVVVRAVFWKRYRTVAWSAAAMLLGTLAAAVVLLPFLTAMTGSADWLLRLRTAQPLPASAWPLALVPDWFGRPRGEFLIAGSTIHNNFNENSLWLGTLTLALVPAAFRTGGRRRRALAVFATLAALLSLSLAADVPVLADALNRLPLFGDANHLRFLMVTQLAAALLAGLGLDRMLASRSCWTVALIAAVIVAAVTGWLAFSHPAEEFPPWDQPHWRLAVQHPDLHRWLVAGAAVLAVPAVLLRRAGPVVTLTAAQLMFHAWDLNPTAPAEIADPPPPPILREAIALAGRDRLAGVGEVLIPNLSTRYGFRDIRGYDFPVPMRLARVFQALDLRLSTTVLPPDRCFPVMDPNLANLLNRSATRILVSDQPGRAVRGGAGEWPARGRTAFTSIHENLAVYPRAYLAGSHRGATAAQALAALLDPRTDLRNEPVFEGVGDSPGGPAGTVRWLHDEPETVSLEVDSPAGGVVVLLDRMAPGWSVTVDGRDAPALHANFLYRGVAVAAGRHTVRWSYRTPGLAAGAAVSLLAWLALAALAWRSPRPTGSVRMCRRRPA